MNTDRNSLVAGRFRGFYPVVVDVETAGFDPVKDALLEVAVVFLQTDPDGIWSHLETVSKHIQPFPGANLDKAALEFTGIDPDHPFRKEIAEPEKEALRDIFQATKRLIREHGCTRAILVGHHPAVDLSFSNAAATRSGGPAATTAPRPPWEAWPTVRPYCPGRYRPPGWNGKKKRRIRPCTMPNARPSCSAILSISGRCKGIRG